MAVGRLHNGHSVYVELCSPKSSRARSPPGQLPEQAVCTLQARESQRTRPLVEPVEWGGLRLHAVPGRLSPCSGKDPASVSPLPSWEAVPDPRSLLPFCVSRRAKDGSPLRVGGAAPPPVTSVRAALDGAQCSSPLRATLASPPPSSLKF